ncbi:hypothetical protein DFP73DRAFT_128651 [Morchella snyderi]|nr:hypothetical protein DFP73DRAFT_128651 [Morchella snyderi]
MVCMYGDSGGMQGCHGAIFRWMKTTYEVLFNDAHVRLRQASDNGCCRGYAAHLRDLPTLVDIVCTYYTLFFPSRAVHVIPGGKVHRYMYLTVTISFLSFLFLVWGYLHASMILTRSHGWRLSFCIYCFFYSL